MTEGKYEEACAAFAESLRLEPATGTLYNIALCSEKLGRTASAWSAYKAVAADASSNADRARMAKEKAALLEPQLSPLCQRHVRQPSLESCVPKGGEWISRRAETKPYSWT
jgi:tetratricopeptide (TPR) repeat protein